jgi:hypothetical protein
VTQPWHDVLGSEQSPSPPHVSTQRASSHKQISLPLVQASSSSHCPSVMGTQAAMQFLQVGQLELAQGSHTVVGPHESQNPPQLGTHSPVSNRQTSSSPQSCCDIQPLGPEEELIPTGVPPLAPLPVPPAPEPPAPVGSTIVVPPHAANAALTTNIQLTRLMPPRYSMRAALRPHRPLRARTTSRERPVLRCGEPRDPPDGGPDARYGRGP